MTPPRSETVTKDMAFYGIALLIGFATALVGTVFHRVVGFMQMHLPQVPSYLGVEGVAAAIFLAFLCASMMCLAVLLVRKFAPEASGSGVQEVEGAMAGLRQVRWQRVLPVKFFGGLLSLGSGLVGGREGPTIHMGASIAQALSQRVTMAVSEARALLGAGAAAGLTAAFNAPVASVLFVIEEARGVFPYSMRTYYAVILASGASVLTTVALLGPTPFMALSATAPELVVFPIFVLLGVVLGVMGVFFNRLVLTSLDYAQQISVRYSAYLWPLLLGLCIGPMVLWLPDATGGGESLVERLVHHPLSLGLLGLLAIVRLVMTVASYAAGTPAGIFAPILAIAVVFSVFFGKLLMLFLPLSPDLLVALAVAGMAGLFSSTIRAPMVGVVLIVELTGAYSLAVPSFLCAMTASVVASSCGGRPIYELLLERTLRLAGQSVPQDDNHG